MQESQLRWMIGLSVVVLLLVAALGYEVDEGDRADPDATAVLWELPDIDAVVRIERDVAGEKLVLTREGELWRMKEPHEAEADPHVIQRFLDDMREMDRGVPLDTEGASAKDYGLGEPPAARVRLDLADGSSQSAVFGDPAPVGWRTYAFGPDGQVVAVGGKSELLSEPSSVFRDHRLLSFDPGQVRRVTLDTGDHRLTVRGQGTAWWVDGFTRADPDRVDDLVMGLLDLRFDRIMALDRVAEPRAVVEIELEDGTVSELRVGERTPMGDLVNAPRATGMVFPESLALLQMGPTDLGDRHAIPISLERDTRVVIEVGDVSWEATRDGALWRSVDLDEQATWARLNALAQASIAYRLEPVEMLAEVAARVTIWRGESQKVIEVGPEGEDGFHRARDVDGGEPYRVRAAELTNLGLD